MTYKVLVSCKQMQESLDELLAETPMPDFLFTTPELTKQGFTSSEMEELIKGHDAAIVGDDVVDEAVLSVAGLKYVCKWGAGVDGIDFKAAERAGIPITNTPGVFGEDVADLAFSYLVSLARSTFDIHHAVSKGNWIKTRGRSLRGLRVVVYGVGNIGMNVWRRLDLSGAKAIGFDPIAQGKIENELINWESSLLSACQQADALIVCCPLTDSTKQSVNKEILNSMNEGAFIVNVARGGVINEDDLIDALSNGPVSGAALDVFQEEPLPLGSKLRKINGVIFGSHNASNSDLSVIEASRLALANLRLGILSLEV